MAPASVAEGRPSPQAAFRRGGLTLVGNGEWLGWVRWGGKGGMEYLVGTEYVKRATGVGGMRK